MDPELLKEPWIRMQMQFIIIPPEYCDWYTVNSVLHCTALHWLQDSTKIEINNIQKIYKTDTMDAMKKKNKVRQKYRNEKIYIRSWNWKIEIQLVPALAGHIPRIYERMGGSFKLKNSA